MKRPLLKTGTIADPIESFNPEAETTFFILKELTLRGHENWIFQLKDLFMKEGEVLAQASRVEVFLKKKIFSYEIVDRRILNLHTLDCLFLRKDPPVDLDYLNHLSLLEILENTGKVFMINSPSGIKKANEKIYPFRFPKISPPSVISKSSKVLFDFVAQHRKVVLKPLNLSGGRGILIARHDDADVKSLLEVATCNFSRYILVQKYLSQASKGDKRVLLLNGEPLGAFLRIAAKDDFRGNIHSGARWKKATLTPHDKKIISQLKPLLLQDGLFFVGLDLIGPYVTEINSTSPMGIRELNHFDNSQNEKKLINWLETTLLSTRKPFH